MKYPVHRLAEKKAIAPAEASQHPTTQEEWSRVVARVAGGIPSYDTNEKRLRWREAGLLFRYATATQRWRPMWFKTRSPA